MLDPLPDSAWTPETAAHLLNRAGFGGPPDDIDALHRAGRADAVRLLVHPPALPADDRLPDWANPGAGFALRRELRAADAETRRQRLAEKRREDFRNLATLRAEWLERMRAAPDPLREKMTLFWHGHFATSAEKVRSPLLLWRQHQTFRTHALGNFRDLTKAITRDPAMLLYLDTVQSHPRSPNENFARELMELFTLGEGHYTERDIRESARAFCGYRIDPQTETFRLVPRLRDTGPKEFLGTTGPLDGDGVVDRILAQPQCARFLARKLWVFFASENPDAPLVDALAAALRESDYALQPFLERLFASAAFHAPAVRHAQIKSPVQWMVQTIRSLEMPLPPVLFATNALRQMGQTLFAPPSVKGWDGGRAWISTSTLLFRYNLSNALLRGEIAGTAPKAGPGLQRAARRQMPGPPLDHIAPAELRGDPERLVDTLGWRLFQTAPAERERKAFLEYLAARPSPASPDTLLGLLHLMMSTPQFQLC